ncbi:hypothetical protein SI856_003823 [Clostridioides difficile]|nr:hypothetical protein [Clostridioides difficile]MBY2759403.1 hypothetical protein [Clostridioides difficile]HBE9455804.1 hypothetical protein [Clostridioides difficile]HBF7727265.1 hypothetical protein [Clostridioides difficile]HBF8529295.1 hypothetical protein [Clostridioides difficile]
MRNNLKEKELEELEKEINKIYGIYEEVCLLGASPEFMKCYERKIEKLMNRWNELKEESE